MRLRRLDVSDSPVVTEEVNCEVHLHFITTQYSVLSSRPQLHDLHIDAR